MKNSITSTVTSNNHQPGAGGHQETGSGSWISRNGSSFTDGSISGGTELAAETGANTQTLLQHAEYIVIGGDR